MKYRITEQLLEAAQYAYENPGISHSDVAAKYAVSDKKLEAELTKKLVEYINEHPEERGADIGKRYGISTSAIYSRNRDMRKAKAAKETAAAPVTSLLKPDAEPTKPAKKEKRQREMKEQETAGANGTEVSKWFERENAANEQIMAALSTISDGLRCRNESAAAAKIAIFGVNKRAEDMKADIIKKDKLISDLRDDLSTRDEHVRELEARINELESSPINTSTPTPDIEIIKSRLMGISTRLERIESDINERAQKKDEGELRFSGIQKSVDALNCRVMDLDRSVSAMTSEISSRTDIMFSEENLDKLASLLVDKMNEKLK